MSESDKIKEDPPQQTPENLHALHEMYSMPGHLIRRAKQKTTVAFAPITKRFNVTPIQYSVLKAISIFPDADQVSLGDLVGLDTSTIGEVMARLEQRELVVRKVEGRQQRVRISAAGDELLAQISPELHKAQQQTMKALTANEARQFLRLISKLVGVPNAHFQPRKRRAKSNF